MCWTKSCLTHTWSSSASPSSPWSSPTCTTASSTGPSASGPRGSKAMSRLASGLLLHNNCFNLQSVCFAWQYSGSVSSSQLQTDLFWLNHCPLYRKWWATCLAWAKYLRPLYDTMAKIKVVQIQIRIRGFWRWNLSRISKVFHSCRDLSALWLQKTWHHSNLHVITDHLLFEHRTKFDKFLSRRCSRVSFAYMPRSTVWAGTLWPRSWRNWWRRWVVNYCFLSRCKQFFKSLHVEMSTSKLFPKY